MLHKCIYCLQEKESNDFNREHVIPKSFGKFRNNFTLLNLVCKDCNDFFSKELELPLGRDSMEALLRIRYDIKPSREFNFKSLNRVSFRMKTRDVYNGMYLELEFNKSRGDMGFTPRTQIGITKDNGKTYEYFLWKDIISRETFEKQGYDFSPGTPVRIVISRNDITNKDKVLQELKDKGFKYSEKGYKDDPFLYTDKIVKTFVMGIVDDNIHRAIAKIAFNYFVYSLEDLSLTAVAFSSDLDDIRQFIRYGKTCERHTFIRNNRPVLLDQDKVGFIGATGHKIILGLNKQRELRCKFILFDQLKYEIFLSFNFNGVLPPTPLAHYFDLKKQKITEIGVSSSELFN